MLVERKTTFKRLEIIKECGIAHHNWECCLKFTLKYTAKKCSEELVALVFGPDKEKLQYFLMCRTHANNSSIGNKNRIYRLTEKDIFTLKAIGV